MLTRAQKEEQVAVMRDKIGRATSIIVADYRGLTVGQVDKLRGQLRAHGGDAYEYQVVKNSVLRLACAGAAAEALNDHFAGPTAVAISYGDPVGLAKVLVDYAKENEIFALKGGFLDGKAIDTGEIQTLATLPSLDQLRGQLVGLLQAPASKLARLLNEPAAQLARLVAARKDALGEG
ncbi:MAG: 50S ribosomal protein L10 [Myxococcota bacterium]|nr:50S ribosomal protein L10 [Myxococcales bacterium]